MKKKIISRFIVAALCLLPFIGWGQNDTLPNLIISNLEVINSIDLEEGTSIDYKYQITNLSENDVNLGVLNSQVYVSDEQNNQELEGIDGTKLDFKLLPSGETVADSSNTIVPSGLTYLGLSINGEVEGVNYNSNTALAYINPPQFSPLSEDIIRRQFILDLSNLPNLSPALIRSITEQIQDSIPGIKLIEVCHNCGRTIQLWQVANEGDIPDVYGLEIEIDGKKEPLQTLADTDTDPNQIIDIAERYPIWGYNAVLHEDDIPKDTDYKRDVTVYLLDTGLAMKHFNPSKHLIRNVPNNSNQCRENTQLYQGYNYLTSPPAIKTDFNDDNGHGTFGFHAIANGIDNIKVVPMKIFNENGRGSLFSMICALYQAIDNGADIVNISAGYYGEASSILGRAVKYANDKGIWIVTSAGNCGQNIDVKDGDKQESSYYPAAFAKGDFKIQKITRNGDTLRDAVKINNVITVASLNPNGKYVTSSNSGSNTVTMATYGNKICGYSNNGCEVIYSGTSMAAFHTTRVLAIEMATNASRNKDKVLKDFYKNRTTSNPNTEVKRTLNMKSKKHWLPPKDWFFNLLRSVGVGR